MNFEPLQDEDADITELSPYSPAEIRRMKDELKTNRAKSRMLRVELERKRRFRDTLAAKQRKDAEILKGDVENLEKIRANMETKANDKRRDDDMREIGQLLLQLSGLESKAADKKKLKLQIDSKLKEQNEQLREIEKEFRHAPDDINKMAQKKQRLTESRFLAIQRKNDKLRKQATEAHNSVRDGMRERQSFHEAFVRTQRHYKQNANILKQMLDQITQLNHKRTEFMKRAAQNRNASNDIKDEVINKLRTAEKMANVERETRILSVHRAIDRTPYWKNASVDQSIQSFCKKPVRPVMTMQKTVELEETMSRIRQLCGLENMSDVIELYKKREENNELLAERLRYLNAEAELLVTKIEGHFKSLNKIDDRAVQGEATAERKMLMLLEKTRKMEANERECRASLQAFRDFYEEIGPKMTKVHNVMLNLVPHGSEVKPPVEPCNGHNYREYQMSFARLAHYFHAIFDYWKQQEHERKCRTDPLYTGTDDDDNPLALQEGKLAKSDYPVAAKLKLLPKELRTYIKRNQFENQDGTPAIMSVRSMDNFAKIEAAKLLQMQTDYLDAMDRAEGLDQRSLNDERPALIPMVDFPKEYSGELCVCESDANQPTDDGTPTDDFQGNPALMEHPSDCGLEEKKSLTIVEQLT